MAEDLIASFAHNVVLYRAMTGGTVTFWGRTERWDKKLKARPRSLHTVDLAVDMIYDERPPLAEALKLAAECGLRLRREGDHDHLEPSQEGDSQHGRE